MLSEAHGIGATVFLVFAVGCADTHVTMILNTYPWRAGARESVDETGGP